MLKEDYPIVSLSSKIRELIKNKNYIDANLWKLANSFEGDMSKAESFFLQGIKSDNKVTYNRDEVAKEVVKYYLNKLKEEQNEIQENMRKIKTLFDNHVEMEHKEKILTADKLRQVIQDFPIHTTYGYDLIQPEL